jgi:hypothetical protein
MPQVTQYRRRVGENAALDVTYMTERGALSRYVVVLLGRRGAGWMVVRVFDNTHDEHEMHRYTRQGDKLPGERVHDGSASEAMNDAIDWMARRGEELVREWQG